ncbi:hypothetical protein PAPYR_5655 [Paratrimastix pyriformis]|uniref:Uncharacterized protein n=1 Tax=Paratrimastix pyriformis TaxID=342808 RepID=A0ABQ8UHJ2_9EUKA|nr:hypothetical protein PAPYR_5655 [Paratrimastix pyriformis]
MSSNEVQHPPAPMGRSAHPEQFPEEVPHCNLLFPRTPSKRATMHSTIKVLSCLHSTGQPNRPSPPIHPFLFHHLQPLTQLVPHIHPSVFPPLFQVYQRLRLSHPCSPYSPFHRSPPYHPIQIQPPIFRLQSTPPLFQSAKSEVMAQVCAKN